MATKMLCSIPKKAKVIDTCANRVAVFRIGEGRESWFKRVKIYGVSWNYRSSPLDNGAALNALTNDIWDFELHNLSHQYNYSKVLKEEYERSLGASGHVYGLDEEHARNIFNYLKDTLEVMVAKALVLQDADPLWGSRPGFSYLSYHLGNDIGRLHFENIYEIELQKLHERNLNNSQDRKLLNGLMQEYPQVASKVA